MNVTIKAQAGEYGRSGWASVSVQDIAKARVVLEVVLPEKGPGVHVVELEIDAHGEIQLLENGGLAAKAQLYQRDAAVSGT